MNISEKLNSSCSCRLMAVFLIAAILSGLFGTFAFAEEIEHEAHEHVFGEWVSVGEEQHIRQCSIEGCAELEAEPHSWDNGVITKEAVGDSDGICTYTCTVCGQQKQEIISVENTVPSVEPQIKIRFFYGEELLKELPVKCGELIDRALLPECPAVNGFVFSHWSTAEGGNPFSFETPVEAETDIRLFAVLVPEMKDEKGGEPLSLKEIDGIFSISSIEDLKLFADMVNGGNDFAGKTVVLLADVDGMDRTIGSNSKKFAGTFDGNFHTIGLSINGSSYQGLFAYNNGTIKNLALTGSVNGAMYSGCLCGYNNGVIESCVNYANGSFAGSYVGGIAGFNSKKATVINCINSGNINVTTAAGYCGGIAGSNSGTIKNCCNTGTVGSSKKSFPIVGMSAGSVENCYYLAGSGAKDLKAIEKTQEEMKSRELVGLLGNGFHYLEGSYPLLYWQGGQAVEPGGDHEHTFGEWNSDGKETHSRKCTVQGCTEKETKEHIWDKGSVVQQPASEKEGILSFTCTVCGEKKTESIPELHEVTVTFMVDNEIFHSAKIISGSTFENLPHEPEKNGYTFKHWSLEKNGAAFDFSAPINNDLALYAVWQESEAANWDYELINDGKAVRLLKYKGSDSVVFTPQTLQDLPVTSLGNEVFAGNSNISYVRLNNSITEVQNGNALSGKGTFWGCSKLRTVILSENLHRIADYMFYGMGNDSSGRIQIQFANIEEIGDFAFSCCNNIVNLQLPEKVKKIGTGAFYQARRLASLNIPGVTEIGSDAFTETIFEENYEKLWKAGDFSGIVYAGNVAYMYMGDKGASGAMPENTTLTIADGTVGVSEFLFVNHYSNSDSCKQNLKTIMLPGSVEFIAPNLFNGFSGITDGDFTGVDMLGLEGTYAEKYANQYENIRFRSLGSSGDPHLDDADYAWYDNAQNREYIINTSAELRAFSDLLCIGEDNFAGAYVRLGSDIDLGGLTAEGQYGIKGYEWESSCSNAFAGTFDGQGHTVSGVYMNGDGDRIGFFNQLAESAVVKNLNIQGKISGRDYIGGIAGAAGSGCKIENCSFSGSVNGNSQYGYVGGIAGQAMKTNISDCTVSGEVRCIMGDAYRELQQGYAGGICGWNYGSSINRCNNSASVHGDGFGTGGIAGFSQMASVSDSTNTGTVSGWENVGGISGKIAASGKFSLHSRCLNTGNVSGKNKTGGIAGVAVGTVKTASGLKTIVGCSNSGAVNAKQSHSGGIAGHVHDSAIDLSQNSGTVSADEFSGGIGGYVLGGRVIDCYNTGNIKAKNYAGGILAFDANSESKLTNCYNTGVIAADHSPAPLVNVYQGKGNNKNCYYLAEKTDTAEAKLLRDFNSGEIAYLLGNAYGQSLGHDEYPVFRNSNQVYQYKNCAGEEAYTNSAELSGTTASHSFGDWVIKQKPGCVDSGSEERNCAVCHKTEAREVPSTGHSVVIDPAKAPDCTHDGLTQGEHCSVCGTVLKEQKILKAHGHKFQNGKCTVCGKSELSAAPSPKTGDEGVPMFWFSCLILSLTAAIKLFSKMKKNKC